MPPPHAIPRGTMNMFATAITLKALSVQTGADQMRTLITQTFNVAQFTLCTVCMLDYVHTQVSAPRAAAAFNLMNKGSQDEG